MRFNTLYDETPKNDIGSPTGEKVELRHRAQIGKDGRRRLIHDKKVAIYELIQASREECEIENIIKRATMGDYNALNQTVGQYADITGCPNSIAEAQQMVIDLKNKFEELPKEIKAKFEFNPEVYVAEFGTETWAEKTGYKAAVENEKALRDAKTKFDADFAKAVENLATGEKIKNKEVKSNE